MMMMMMMMMYRWSRHISGFLWVLCCSVAATTNGSYSVVCICMEWQWQTSTDWHQSTWYAWIIIAVMFNVLCVISLVYTVTLIYLLVLSVRICVYAYLIV